MAISPIRPKSPPLNALRAFEAAGRLGGFTAAADELCVTPGAIAQHIKALEAWFDAPLFERRSQGVRLTSLGDSVLRDFTAAFDQLGEAVQNLRSRVGLKHIRIAALPSVAQLWLSPRLPAIRQAAGDVTISVTAMEHRPNLMREPFDVSIFYESLPTETNLLELGPDSIFPVCAPSVARRLNTVMDLSEETFLHDTRWKGDWGQWISDAGKGTVLDTRGPVFSLYSLAVEEAINGAGVLMGRRALVHRHVSAGTLVAPFDTHVTIGEGLCLDTTHANESNGTLAAMIDTLTQTTPP